MPKKPEERDSVAREVDRLLKQLPGADPMLRGTPDPASAPTSPASTFRPRPMVPRPPRLGPTSLQIAGLWGRVASGAILGAALTQWPYGDCGWALYAYLAAVAVVLLSAGWAAVTAWRFRNPAAHVLALVVGFWGIVLAAERILPRVGYAAESRTWTCVAPAAPQTRPAPVTPPPLPDSTPTADSTASAAASTPSS